MGSEWIVAWLKPAAFRVAEPRYFDIACRRIEHAQAQGDMFVANDNVRSANDNIQLDLV
jgi:hypothetical protein